MRALPLLIVVLLLAGCAAPTSPTPPTAPDASVRVGGALLHAGGTRGGLALVHLAEGDRAEVTFPEHVLVLQPDGHLRVPDGPVAIERGSVVQFLAPLGASSLNVTLSANGESRDVALALAEGDAFVSGSRVVDLLKVQRDRFAHRTPGQENYSAAVTYFEEFFADLGYTVETFKTPLPDNIVLPIPNRPGAQSVVSVLGTKRGVEMPDRYIVFGGHFDVVDGTTEGAFDNTAGTMATLALAEAFSKINTSRSVIFAAWGGEEDGLLGSQAWLLAHPDLIPKIDLYVNYDVSGMTWPAPLPDPAPTVFATGPDGPLSEALAAQHQTIVRDWLQTEAPFDYQTVVQGQAQGAGVNAQSDHTTFMSRGIPVVFQFTSHVGDAFAVIHSESDTLANMTAYALLGPEGVGQELNVTQAREGERILARSFEPQTMGGFYLAALMDAGILSPVRPGPPASFPSLDNVRS